MKLVIFGMGVSGVSALKLALKKKYEVSVVNQGEPLTWKCFEEIQKILPPEKMFEQDEAEAVFKSADEIILSPGIPSTLPILHSALKKGVKIVSEIEFAARHIQIPLLAVTGTNGKTTFCTLLAKALEMIDKKVFLGGNIGIALSELAMSEKKYDYAVVEVSSFQMETIEKFHPKVAVILNISLSHTERYTNIRDYGLAKLNIAKNQNTDDFFISTKLDSFEKEVANIKASKTLINKSYLETLPLDFSKMKTKGNHYQYSYAFLFQIFKNLELPKAKEILQNLVNNFEGLPHRIEFVEEKRNLFFYNDSKSTNIASTIAALESFEDKVWLILGGQMRDPNLSFLQELFKMKDKIQKVLLMGHSTEKAYEALNSGLPCVKCFDFEGVFKYLKQQEGSVLFSPAFPSFDLFKNYQDRGDKFKNYVKNWN
ncbi:MAG: UDP-N-acetylmuramoyl-L-alanine--D-glutamate ligase [Bacteriovoracaceae bacterium]|nr:UDP-N-acetylmuramoyl-L-alanine--D-glutamate ligase [Bacteriovoracaceae bacterium]